MSYKNYICALIALPLLALGGCGVVEEAGTDVSRKFDEGITGQGRLISPNQMGDRYGSYYQ